jgi:pimeloyl-ACP methyl ester carboxylesterase
MGAIAKAGYATIRIDKPGQGDSDGPIYSDLKFSEEREALLQGLRLAKTFDFVDKDNIAIFGHSMGGILGPEVASKESVKGVAAMAFAIKSWFEYSLENTRRQVLLGGADPVEVEDYIKQLTSAYYYLYEKQMTPAAIIEAYPELKPIIQSFSPDLNTTSGVGIHFFQEIARSNRMEYWSKFTGEALLLYGENDFVCAEWDHQYVADFLNSKRPGSAKFVKVPKTDHFFTATTSYKDSFQRGMLPGQKKSEETVPILLPWLDKVLRGKG